MLKRKQARDLADTRRLHARQQIASAERRLDEWTRQAGRELARMGRGGSIVNGKGAVDRRGSEKSSRRKVEAGGL